MSKLNVVIPDEYVEVIGKDGARTKYRRVERAAKAGDVIKITDSSAPYCVVNGAFYEVKRLDVFGDPQIIDEDGDEFDAVRVDYEVYEKVAEPAQIKYREVKRPAKVGERIKIVNEQMACGEYKIGAEMVVTEAKWPKIHSVNADYNGTEKHLFYGEYVVLEPIDERLTVGDYVRVIKTGTHFADEGTILRIYDIVDYGSNKIRCELLDGTRKDHDYFYESEIVHATEAEVAAAKEELDPRSKFAKGDKVRLVSGGGTPGLFDYETGGIYTVSDPKYLTGKIEITGGGQPTAYAKHDQLEKVSAAEAAEFEKWAAIGRKVGEFKHGDIVSFVKNSGKIKGIGTVEDVAVGAIGVRKSATTWDGSGYEGVWFECGDTATLIVPVEQRFDREEAA